MENKPTITFSTESLFVLPKLKSQTNTSPDSFSESGDENLFLTLSTHLRKILQNHPVQWQRSYGRVPHKLKLDVKFLPLTSALLNRNDLVTKPYFHVFWTDCSDIDFYRSSVRSEMASWMSELSGNEIYDWLIIVVTGEGSSRLVKPKLTLPRSSLADKIKSDFCSKSPEKMHVLHDPMKESSRTNESWSLLATKLAALTITCLEESVTKYEDRVRAERERRNEKSWNFCSYFIMQEELAFMFEMLGLHEEALIQYNELDAMFTQYLLNAHAGVVAHWLSSFTSPITRWRSLSLWRRIDGDARQMLIEDKATLIDVRNYLFARHCHLLLTLGRIEELTKLMHIFLHATIMELDILEVELPQGAKECWVFMSCLELAQTLERNRYQLQKTNNSHKEQSRSDSPTVMMTDNLRLETANLWNLAKRKLLRLAELCGLMPDVETNSKDLQMVVDLISGMGEEEERDGLAKSPSLILREALSSKENFRSQYLELSEMAMGTYKHMARYRLARLIGNDLADFYMRSGEFVKAESFLVDAVRLYSSESWTYLCSNISEKLAQCYKQLCNVRRYIRFCCILMCDSSIDITKRLYYCDELTAHSNDIGDSSLSILLAVFATVTAVKFIPANNSLRYNSHQIVQVNVHSNAPKTIKFHSAQLTLKYQEANSSDITNKSSNDTVEEDRDFDAFSYATFSSDEDSEVESISLKSTEKSTENRVKKLESGIQKNNIRHRKRRRYLSSSSFDSVLAIHQKPKMDSSGLIQLVIMEDPCAQPSKCMANTMPSQISINIESETKEEEVAWAGITCRTAHQLLRRQDSCQSLCSIHGGASNVVIEPTEHILETKEILIKPGENCIEMKLDTSKSGEFTLQQLCLTQNRVHFVLPRILPIVSYTVNRIQPFLLITHKPKIYCGMEERFTVKLTCGDYEISDASKSEGDNDLDRLLYFSFSKQFQITSGFEITIQSENLSETEKTSAPLKIIDSGKCSVLLPNFSKGSIVTMTMSCIYRLPDTIHKADWKYHRRTHSAPPSTVRQPRRPVTANNNNAEEALQRTNGIDVTNSNSTPAHKSNSRSGESPVKKFLSFVREVAERTDKSPKVPNVNSVMRDDDYLEVTLEEPVSNVSATSEIPGGISKRVGLESRPKSGDLSLLNDWTEDSASGNMPSSANCIGNGIITVKKSSSMSNNRSTTPNTGLHCYGNAIPIPEETDGENISLYMCNISVDMPWDDILPTQTSVPFIQPLYFSHRRHHYCDDEQILLVIVDNVSPYNFFLKNFCIHLTNSGKMKVLNLNSSRECTIASTESVTLAWKLCSASTASSCINSRFAVDIGSKGDDENSDVTTTPAIYEFELENISTIYCISTKLGDGNSKLSSGVMTTLEITVKRLRNDLEHEHTRNGQQLLMFQVVDTRGRWAVCGKSTGLFSLPVLPTAVDGDDNTSTPKKYMSTTTLEVMPLIDGWLHRPSVVLQRYLKRRSSEFDEELSSTDSPVLKPPLLVNFLPGEVLYLDQYKQVHVTKSLNHQDEKNILQ